MSEPASITLYDSYLKKEFTLEPQKTVEKNTIKLYSCGPTVYNYQSIGNMRAAWLPDTIVNIAKLVGWKTKWVLNITDVGHLVGDGDEGEDKIESGAKRDGKTVQEIVNYYTEDYKKQCKALNFELPGDKMNPKATEYIKEQMILALELLKEGKAYLLEDGIYFDSEKLEDKQIKNYLKEHNIKMEIEGNNAFTGRDIKNTTKNPGDFALWKFVAENTIQKWKFADFEPAGKLIENNEILEKWGTPGWHSECVCMICGVLGKQVEVDSNYFNNFKNETVIDLHTGGEDHIDIHHKNEILQSEALGFHLSKYWVHNKFVMVDGGKMSKSLGNVYLVTGEKAKTGFDSLEEKGYDPLAYRLMLFESHYTNQLDFTWDKLKQSQTRLYNMRKEAAKLNRTSGSEVNLQSEEYQSFLKLLTDNLNLPKFLEEYQELLTLTANSQEKSEEKIALLKYLETNLLKLNLFPAIPQKMEEKAQQRLQAKADKNYQLSDDLRGEIVSNGWQIDDYKDGYGLWQKPF